MSIRASLPRGGTLWILPLILGVLSLGVLSCGDERTLNSEGTVILSLTDFDGLPFQVSVNQAAQLGAVTVDSLTLQNVPKDPNGATSELMSIELDSVEITYERRDTGTRVPPPRVRSIFSLVPVGGTSNLENLEILGFEQLLSPPLSDLLFENGGFDTETGSNLIILDVNIRFFGRTLGGDEVASGFDSFRIEFLP